MALQLGWQMEGRAVRGGCEGGEQVHFTLSKYYVRNLLTRELPPEAADTLLGNGIRGE